MREKIIIIIIIITVITGIWGAGEARAQEMRSQNFIINGGNFNMTSGEKASQNFKLADVVGQTAAGMFLAKGYAVKTGFMNTSAGQSFSFSVNPSTIDFGTLTPNNPVEKSLQISVSNGNATGYSVRVSENQPLSTMAGAEIPDTVCNDTSSNICNINQASEWKNNSVYGFGYRITGRTTPQDFNKELFYRPFPANRSNDPTILIMQSTAKKVMDQSKMTLRVNIGPNQPVGQYRNVLIFSALVGI